MPFLKIHDANLWYIQEGEGPDIVWIPGGDNVAEDWSYQVEAFRTDFRNTAFDPRGAGRTTSERQPPWSIENMAHDCAELIRSICEPPVIVVGLSMGSFVALQLAIDSPELVHCAIAMGTAAKPTGFCLDWMKAEVAFRNAGASLPFEFAVHHYGAFMYPSEVLGDDVLWAKLRPFVERSYGHRDGPLLAAQWQACIDFDVSTKLPDCLVPIDVIGFSQDMQIPPSLGRHAAELAGNGRFHLLEGLSHTSLVGHRPEVVNSQIRSIIASRQKQMA